MDMTDPFDITGLRTLAETMRRSGVHDLRIRKGRTMVRLRLPVAGIMAPVAEIPVTAPAFGRVCLTAPDRALSLPRSGDVVAKGAILAFLDLDGPIVAARAPVAGTLAGCLCDEGRLVGFGDPLFTLRPL